MITTREHEYIARIDNLELQLKKIHSENAQLQLDKLEFNTSTAKRRIEFLEQRQTELQEANTNLVLENRELKLSILKFKTICQEIYATMKETDAWL